MKTFREERETDEDQESLQSGAAWCFVSLNLPGTQLKGVSSQSTPEVKANELTNKIPDHTAQKEHGHDTR